MANRLEIQVGANIKDLQGSLGRALKLMDKLKDENDKLSKSFKAGEISAEKYYSSIAKNSIRMKNASNIANKFKSSVGSTNKAMGSLTKGTADGGAAMTSFSRVIQDAPFGIMGVSNNITNLTETFGHLKKQTGSAGGALKAMLANLKGFGGITLGISVVTSLLVVFGDKIFKAKDKVKSLREEQEKLTESLENYKLGLEAVTRAKLQGEQSAQKELVTFRLLRSQIQNTTLSQERRLDAVRQLKKQFPSYLGNLSDEKILNGDLSGIYDKLTTSILNRAKATAATNQIVKNSEQLLTLESQLAAKQVERGKLVDALRLKQKKLDAAIEAGATDSFDYLQISIQKAENRLSDFDKGVNKLKSSIQNLELTNIDLEQAISKFGGIASGGTSGGAVKVPIAVEPFVLSSFDASNSKAAQEFQQSVNSFFESPILKSNSNLTALNEYLEKRRQAIIKVNEDINNLLESGLENGLASFGQAIGSALANGTNVIEAAGASLLGSIGNILQQLGKYAIGLGVGLKGIKKALATLNPAAAIGAGVALVALGSAFASKSQKLAGSIGGGGSTASSGVAGGGSATSSQSGSTVTAGSSGGGFGGKVVFEIQGTRLVGVLQNTLRQNRNIGGVLSLD